MILSIQHVIKGINRQANQIPTDRLNLDTLRILMVSQKKHPIEDQPPGQRTKTIGLEMKFAQIWIHETVRSAVMTQESRPNIVHHQKTNIYLQQSINI